ncbi:MAG TPA: TonB-dependent receptor [Steroidobacteraceae bacterium]|jgi:iron complex outermembrane receptor protein|nr:TonB-dependent receptor [Steroidobacteraceae bacterium]
MTSISLDTAIRRALAAAGLASLAAVSHAQQAEAQRLEEITVTARKVQENLQDTPIAVTAITGAALEDRQVFRTDTLDQLVPNLQFANNAPLAGNNASSAVFIRGIGQTDPTSTVDPGVGLYIDDVYIGNAVGGNMELRDIANVQVLRGPQGTLFGRNTIGGAVLLSTADPGDEFGGKVRAGFGEDNLIDGFIALDAPFSDSFKTRWSFGLRKQDGYVTRPDGTDLGDSNTFTGMTKWVWTPSDSVRAALAIDYTEADENGSPLVFAAINEAATFPRVSSQEAGCPGVVFPASGPVPMLDDPRCANDFQGAGPYANNGSVPLLSELRNYGASLNLSFDLSDSFTLKSITAYRKLDWQGIRDADNTPLTILHTYYDVTGDQLSEELQLTYQSDRTVGVFGLYYFEQTSDDIVTVELNPPPPGIQRDSDNNKVDNQSWAAFTQWTFKFSDMFAATIGGRYTEDKKDAFPDQFDFATPTVKQVPAIWYSDTFSSFTPSASLQLNWNEDAMSYLSYSEGFKGGGWNSHFNAVLTPEQQAALHPFAPEEAQTIELGTKLDLADNTLRLNLAIFSSDYTDMQLTYRGPAPAGVAPFVTNAGETSIDGAEVELTWLPLPDLNIEASLGYLDATIDSLDNIPFAVLPPGLVEGNALPYAPELQGHFGIAYTAHAGGWEIVPRVDVSYQDETFFDATDTVEIAQVDPVTTVNVQVQLRSEKWRFIAGLNNATDELYPIAGNSSLTTGSGYAEIAYARPQEWFLTVEYDF